MPQKNDIEIARAASMQPIREIAGKLGIEAFTIPYGSNKAKVDFAAIEASRPDAAGKLILMTAVSPTPAGEGKTTTTIGLGDALNRIGRQAAICLREPSLGPCFGMKGGAAGGGYAQVVPMTDINLHFTGDFHAIGAAHNLLAALVDNHIHWGANPALDPRRITWRRVVDMNDRALRQIAIGLGGTAHGVPREAGFDITSTSEVMAIFCLAKNLAELEQRLGRIVVGYTRDREPVTARELHAHGAMTALLRDAFAPNLVQTLENNPAFIHGGPFANIAHGCNSAVATRTALRLADYVVTEAGFGSDLGAEKFFDIKCRTAGLRARCGGPGRDHQGAQDARRRAQERPAAPGQRSRGEGLRKSGPASGHPESIRRPGSGGDQSPRDRQRRRGPRHRGLLPAIRSRRHRVPALDGRRRRGHGTGRARGGSRRFRDSGFQTAL